MFGGFFSESTMDTRLIPERFDVTIQKFHFAIMSQLLCHQIASLHTIE